MNINPIILSIPVYFLLIAVELLVQFFSRKNIYRLSDAITNISCGITQQITGAFLKVLSVVAYQYVFDHWALMQIPVNWWSITLLVLSVDFCYYWSHRMSHEINLFWGGHVVHHQSEDYNFSVALRQGSFQILWTFWFYLPLALLGFDTVTFLLVSAFNIVYQFWIHTETIGKLPRPIEWVFNTPSHHRVHHGRNPKYIDKNHAGSLIIWDRMFGTFQAEEERPAYGITKPVNSWNPLWVNLQHYADMSHQIVATSGLMNKWLILWNKPGWRPMQHGGPLSVPEIDPMYHKYDPKPGKAIGYYALFQFMVVLIITSVFLFSLSQFSFFQKTAYALLIIWSVAQIGILLDNVKKWTFLEYLRIIFAASIVILLISSSVIKVIAVALSLVSMIWFIMITKGSFKTQPAK